MEDQPPTPDNKSTDSSKGASKSKTGPLTQCCGSLPEALRLQAAKGLHRTEPTHPSEPMNGAIRVGDKGEEKVVPGHKVLSTGQT